MESGLSIENPNGESRLQSPGLPGSQKCLLGVYLQYFYCMFLHGIFEKQHVVMGVRYAQVLNHVSSVLGW